MTETQFYSNWVDKTIQIPNNEPPSAWKVEAIYGDKNDQFKAVEYHQDRVLRGKPSAAYGVFRCRNIRDLDDVAVIKVIMQITYAGSEWTIHAERARQATTILPETARRQVDNFDIMTAGRSKYTPRIRQRQECKEGGDGIVPGGFMLYILIDCLQAGVVPKFSRLFWDEDESGVCIVGFRDGYPAAQHVQWRDVNWIFWCLANCPQVYSWTEERLPHPNKDGWTL
ncbi:hypothetical protein BDW69DRAFT_203362 [Aspergillus filifer]